MKNATPRQYADWLVKHLEQGGVITHFYDYPLSRSNIKHTAVSCTVPARCGARAIHVLEGEFADVSRGHGHDHGVTYHSDGTVAGSGWVPLYSDVAALLHRRGWKFVPHEFEKRKDFLSASRVGGLGDDMQDSKESVSDMLADWAANVIHITTQQMPGPHSEIAHVHITITLADGTKKDYMQGTERHLTKDEQGVMQNALCRSVTLCEPKSVIKGTAKVKCEGKGQFLDGGSEIVERVRRRILQEHLQWLAGPTNYPTNFSRDFTGEYIDGEPKR